MLTNPNRNEEKEKEMEHIDKKALAMMAKMGYKLGSGLGKNEQGILKPVTVSVQYGKCGLGTSYSAFDTVLEDTTSEVKQDNVTM